MEGWSAFKTSSTTTATITTITTTFTNVMTEIQIISESLTSEALDYFIELIQSHPKDIQEQVTSNILRSLIHGKSMFQASN